MSTPRKIGDKFLESADQVLPFLRLYLVPQFKLVQRKFAAMMGTPAIFSQPFWDGESWHAVQAGTVGPDIVDADATIEVADGNHRVARRGVITADRIVNLGIADLSAGAAFVIWNLSEFTLNVTLTFEYLVLPPGYVGRAHVQGALWNTSGKFPILFDPVLFP